MQKRNTSARTAAQKSTKDEANNVNPQLQQCNVSGSASRKPNPYQLVYWRSDWSESKTRRNNTKYWEFEIEHNGLRLP